MDNERAGERKLSEQDSAWLELSPHLLSDLARLAPWLRERADQITARRLEQLMPWLEVMSARGQTLVGLDTSKAVQALIHPLFLGMLDSWNGQPAALSLYFEGLADVFQTYLAAGVRFEVLLGIVDIQESTLLETLLDLFRLDPTLADPAVQAHLVEAVLWVHNRQLLTVAQVYFARQEAITRQESLAVGEREQIIARQQRAIMELSTPIVPIFKNILVLPLVGQLDQQRTEVVTEALLMAIVQHQAEMIIVDITGLSKITAQTAAYLVRSAQAARLLGARLILVGISGRVAMAMIDLNVDLGGIVTYGDLQAGFRAALAEMGLEIRPTLHDTTLA